MANELPPKNGTEHNDGRDLIVLVADGTMEATAKGLLSRPEALGIRPIDFLVVPHPERDPGVFHRSPEFLEPFRRIYRHALVMLDREGSGQEAQRSRSTMERELEERLAAHWQPNRCAAVVLDPELEIWWWSDSPHVEKVLGWGERDQNLRAWLVEQGFVEEGPTRLQKPDRPKEAVETALRVARKPRSSALYRQLATKVSLWRCEDPAFIRLREILARWCSPVT